MPAGCETLAASKLLDIFLRLNGYRLVTSTDDAYHVIVDTLTTGGDRFNRLEAWLRDHTQ